MVVTLRAAVPLASIPPRTPQFDGGLADNGGGVMAPRVPRTDGGDADRCAKHRGPNRENRYLTGLLAVRGLPFDTTYLQARIVAGYRKGGT